MDTVRQPAKRACRRRFLCNKANYFQFRLVLRTAYECELMLQHNGHYNSSNQRAIHSHHFAMDLLIPYLTPLPRMAALHVGS
jgi:hypothetical protein